MMVGTAFLTLAFLTLTMNYIPRGDHLGGAGCDDPHVRICDRPMPMRMGLFDCMGRWAIGTVCGNREG